jgi:hypothetical protein
MSYPDRLARIQKRACIATVTLTASLALCPLAGARIVLAKSIGGVSLGMTRAGVAKVLGKGAEEPGVGEYDYRHDSYQIIFTSGHASSIETFDRGQRTPAGLGVGSSLATVRKHEPGLHCNPSDGEIDCYVGSIKRGHLYTDFYFENGRSSMTAVIVGEGYT